MHMLTMFYFVSEHICVCLSDLLEEAGKICHCFTDLHAVLTPVCVCMFKCLSAHVCVAACVRDLQIKMCKFIDFACASNLSQDTDTIFYNFSRANTTRYACPQLSCKRTRTCVPWCAYTFQPNGQVMSNALCHLPPWNKQRNPVQSAF
jgi:hypothetical protein